MSRVRTYRSTIYTRPWSQRGDHKGPAKTLELYIESTRAGSIRVSRKALAKRGVQIYQTLAKRFENRKIPKGHIIIKFQREESAQRASREIHVNAREMTYRGKEFFARRLPSLVFRWNRARRRIRRKRP